MTICGLAGPGGILGAAEGLSYLTLAAGAVVLVLQVPAILNYPSRPRKKVQKVL